MNRAFAKLQGTGNDFVVIVGEPDPRIVPLLCDRKRGVGADGVLFLTELSRENATAFMTIINRDGSRPEMCGNGVRCASRHLVEAYGFPNQHTILTDAGPRGCIYGAGMVDVEMGEVRIESTLEMTHDDTPFTLHRVNVGNPHAVAFTESHDGVAELGAVLNDAHAAFPDGVNLEFAVATESGFDVVVFERGVGLTDACGTGACAVAFAAWEIGVHERVPTKIGLPGGTLTISPDGVGRCRMKGDVANTFSGELSPQIMERLKKENR